MNHLRDLTLTAVLLAGLAVPATAAVITVETPSTIPVANGLMTTVAGTTTLDFNAVPDGAQPAGFTPATGTIPGGGVIGVGNSGLYAAPNGDTSPFYAVALNPTGGPVVPATNTFTPGGTHNYFGLYWGSIDTYNTIEFFSGATLVASFTGGAFAPANGDQTAANTNQFVDFFFTDGDTYDSVRLSTTTLNFELDNVAYGTVAVPEPSTLALLGAGLLGLGAVRRRRQRAA